MIDRVYLVAGEDGADDPAYGVAPVKQGPPELVARWLRARPDLDGLSVVRHGEAAAVWARDYLGTQG